MEICGAECRLSYTQKFKALWMKNQEVRFSRLSRQIAFSCVLALGLSAQEPAVKPSDTSGPATRNGITSAAIAASKQDPAAVERGGRTFGQYCAGCHGASATGGPGAPDLVRSVLVLDDEKGILIAPVIREGRPDKGMPKLNVSEAQISDIVAWLHARTYAAGHRTTYVFGNVVTGDAKKGEAYFNGAGRCNTCHSATGDLAGIARKYDPFSLQGRWLQPRSASRRGRSGGNTAPDSKGMTPTVTVTLASGQHFSGTLDHIDDFTVSLRDSEGNFHSFSRDGETPKVEVHDPLKAHTDLLRTYTDADIHNVTTYLVTLK
jgi:cytochrome c oxidase cbb3-type subunit 3